MAEQEYIFSEDKEKMYEELCTAIKGLTMDVPYRIANLANTSAVLNQALKNINWVGFYLMEGGKLVLGPFQGKTACIEIRVGKGVCGSAVMKNETVRVQDVMEFPGHIACDAASRSEIVVPIRKNGEIIGVLDIDSPMVGRFDEKDQAGLERVVNILEKVL